MKKTQISAISNIIQGILLLIGGFIFIRGYESFWQGFRLVCIFSLILNGLLQLFTILTKRNVKILQGILVMLIDIGFAIFLIVNKAAFYEFIPYIIGWWALLIAIAQFIIYYAYRLDSLKHTGYVLLLAIISTIFAIILLVNPIRYIRMLSIIAGIYIIFCGICSIIEGTSHLLSEKYKNQIASHFHIPVPIFFASIIPISAFMSLDKQAKTEKLPYYTTIQKSNVDLEVFVYIKGQGPESLGHVDFSFNNTIYSYGCHDPNNRRLFGTLGDGVLIVSDRDKFLNQAMSGDKKTIISYGIKLTDKQKEIIQSRINNLLARSIPWHCNFETDNTSCDYASRVYKDTKCKMYKFAEGKFKTYFVFSTNCVLLVDEILKSDDLNLINLNGIITPGSYIEFLNHEYLQKNSSVVSKTFYRFK